MQPSIESKRPIVWAPIPGSSQEIAVDTRVNIVLYHGTRGPGKTDAQVMKFKRRVGLGYGIFWRGIIFDREYKNLDDLIGKTKKYFPRFNDGAQWLSSTSAYRWVWPTGEELLFRSAKEIDDYNNYHGQEYPFIGWNELTKYPNSGLFDMMMSCNRSSFVPELHSPRDEYGKIQLLPEIPLETFATTNSDGPGHGWVRERFIDVAPYGKVVHTEIEVFDPRSQKDVKVKRSQVSIFGSYKENIYLSGEYIAGLKDATKNNENLRKAWLEGDWDVVAGGAIDDVWIRSTHVLPQFVIPDSWYVDRTFDWGSTKPFSVGWWAEANGEEAVVTLNGKDYSFCPPRGSLIQFAEWYGTEKPNSDKGVKMGSRRIAQGIKEREQSMMRAGWIKKQPNPGPADNQIRNVIDDDGDTIEKKMSDEGIHWTESDKSPGSRVVGLELFRDYLYAAKIGAEDVHIYFMQNCRFSISLLPTLPRDPDKQDDVDSEAEDHCWDMTRYRLLRGRTRIATQIPVRFARSA